MKVKYIVLATALLLIAVAVPCTIFWYDTSRLQAIGGLAAFLAAVLLIGLTAVYVQTNHDMLSLMREQWNQTHAVALRFGITAPNGNGRVWIANLGFSHVLITKITVRRLQGRTTNLYKHAIVNAGRVRSFSLPSDIWHGCAPACDVEAQLEYEHFGKTGITEARAYSLTPSTSGVVHLIRVRKGIHGLWPVKCPRCKKHAGMHMKTKTLVNFGEGERRQSAIESDLWKSCPNHASNWLLTVEDVDADAAYRKEDEV